MKKVNYRLPDTGKSAPAFIVCATGEATILFVPSFDRERPDAIVIAHDDDLDRVFEDIEMN